MQLTITKQPNCIHDLSLQHEDGMIFSQQGCTNEVTIKKGSSNQVAIQTHYQYVHMSQ